MPKLSLLSRLHPQRSIRARLVLAVSITAVFFATLLSLIVGFESAQIVKADRGLLLSEVAAQMARELDKGMNDRLREIQIFASLAQLRAPAVPLGEKRALVEKLKESFGFYAWIGMTDSEGNIIVGTDDLLVGKNVGQRDWFVQGRKGPHAGDVHDAFLLAKILPKAQDDPLPLRLVDVSAPITDANGRFVGVLCGHLSWAWARRVRADLLQTLQDSLEVMVLNREGRILLGTPELPEQSGRLELESVSRAMAGGNGSLSESWYDGSTYLTGYARGEGYQGYPGLGWLFLVREHADAAFAQARRVEQRTLAAGVLFALLFSLMIWQVIGRVVKPLAAISDAANRIRLGDDAARIPRYRGSDEVVMLSDSLSNLIETQREHQAKLQQLNQQLSQAARVFDHSIEGIIITDSEQRILRVNRAFTNITGYSEAESVGQTPRILNSGRQDTAFYSSMWASINRHGQWQGEIWNRRKNGEIYPEWLTVSVVHGAAGEVSHYIGIFADITERKHAEEHILHLAHHDALTNLPNRLLFFDRLEQSIHQAKRNRRKVALLFIDLDFFKNINDSIGHQVGDMLLQAVAKRLSSAVREGDTVARLGGDEFVVTLPGVREAEDAVQVAQKIIQAIAQPYEVGGYTLNITASIGLSVYPDDGHDVVTLVKNADTAMYHTKEQGRNDYQFFTKEMNARARERMQLENALRSALANGEFHLAYQPQYALRDGAISGIEVLLRWQHPQLGTISPAKFIPIAEEIGVITAMGEWVLREGCRQYVAWYHGREDGPRLAVNISAMQFRQTDLVALVEQVLAETGMPAQRLELEITEGIFMESADVAVSTLQRLHDCGIQITLDDFGTGYSSLGYIKQFSIDRIKIDQSFVRDLTESRDDEEIVSAVVSLARSLHLQVLAEGVETEAQLEKLRALGCDEVQGFYLSRPLTAAKVAQLLNR